MSKLKLNFAGGPYDHFLDIYSGQIRPEGIDLNFHHLHFSEIFYRFTLHREWEVAEMSTAKLVAQIAGERPDIWGLPIFPSRVFRLSNIYIRRDRGIAKPEHLRGKKMGTPEWSQTASVYTRGFLVDDIGIPLSEIDWYQAGINMAGRTEKVKLRLPDGVRLTPVPDKSLSDMLANGDLDAVMCARPPDCFLKGHPDVTRLFPDYQKAEEDYYDRTGIFPIMHIIAIRRDVVEANPWVPVNLVSAFEEAKDRSVKRALELTASLFPIPWGVDVAEKRYKKFGGDYFPYGIEPNRKTLEAFLKWCHSQGVSSRLLKPEEMFPPTLMGKFKT